MCALLARAGTGTVVPSDDKSCSRRGDNSCCRCEKAQGSGGGTRASLEVNGIGQDWVPHGVKMLENVHLAIGLNIRVLAACSCSIGTGSRTSNLTGMH